VDSDVYDAPDGRAIISYSNGSPCEEGVPGIGKIPRDTVVEIYVSLTKLVKLSDLLVPGKEYSRIQAVHTPTVYYVDKQEGAKNYLVKVRQADPETIVAVDGGYQEEFTVQLYIYPINAYPPVLLPTVSPKKVQILKGRFKPCR
jgi:hypothetical protein